jgi:hypothetical protein
MFRNLMKKNPNQISQDILFPGQSETFKYPTTFTPADVKKAAIKGRTTGVIIIGCVTYTSSFSSEPHQSGYIYDVDVPAPSGWGSIPIRIGMTVQLKQFRVIRSLFGGFYAD